MGTPWARNRYPPARRSDHYDQYKSEKHGVVSVHDPYNWLEHNSPETERWANDQVAFTQAFLDQNPDRQTLEDEIRRNTDYAKVSVATRSCSNDSHVPIFVQFSAPSLKDDGRWYWYYNSGLQPQSGVNFVRRRIKHVVAHLRLYPVIYRSKNNILPDMSKEEGPGGEVFSGCQRYLEQ